LRGCWKNRDSEEDGDEYDGLWHHRFLI
jgi:hypothetical protein